MDIALLILMGLLGVGALAATVLAIRAALAVDRAQHPDDPNAGRAIAGMFGAAWTPPAGPAVAVGQMRLRTRLFAAFACLVALAGLSFLLPFMSRPPADEPAEVFDEAGAGAAPTGLPIGSTLEYIRSNQDGTKPETILIHIASPSELHVVKMVERCTDAAYVTARFDPRTREATRLVGGRLTREGTQAPQAFLDLDPSTRKLTVRLNDPASAPAETHDAPPAPWRMYDLDLAEFALFGPSHADSFSFGLALAWPDGSQPLVRILGEASAQKIDDGMRTFGVADDFDPRAWALGDWPQPQPFALYAVTGEAFGEDGGGFLWLNPDTGHVIEASLGRPNHPGYDDLHLSLQSIELDDGEEVWRNALAAHWEGC